MHTTEDLPSVKKVMQRVIEDHSGSVSYQEIELTKHSHALNFFQGMYSSYINSVLTYLHNPVKVKQLDVQLFTDVLAILATEGWEKHNDASFGHKSLHNLSVHITIPLEKADVNTGLLQEEWEDVVSFAKM